MQRVNYHGRHLWSAFWLLLLFVVFTRVGLAERLPLRPYSTADGLASNVINRIVRDSRGYLWFCTDEGLSRFDGYSFTNYGTDQGLPHRIVNDLLETPEGNYWVATELGLVRFDPRGVPSPNVQFANVPATNPKLPPRFTVFAPADPDRAARGVMVLLRSRDGTIWCGTRKGLMRLSGRGEQLELLPVDMSIPREFERQSLVSSLIEDRFGSIWMGTMSGLYRRWADGTVAHYGAGDGLPIKLVHDVLEDHLGNLWVATPLEGLSRFSIDAGRAAPKLIRNYHLADGLNTEWVFDLFESSRGTLWVGTNRGLSEISLQSDSTGELLHSYTKQNGFSYQEIASLGEDRDGNLWLGTNNTGAMKLPRNGFVTFGELDGILEASSIFEGNSGDIYARGMVIGDRTGTIFEGAKLNLGANGPVEYYPRLGHFDGARFDWLIPRPLTLKYLGSSDRPMMLQSRKTGDWWLGTGNGLHVFAPVANFADLKNAVPQASYANGSGLAGSDVVCIYQDRQSDIWISTYSPVLNGLARWDSATNSIHDMAQTPGLPSLAQISVRSFAEDRAGNLWIGLTQGGVARYANGHFTVFSVTDGLAPGTVNTMYADRAGRLWIATARGGISRLDDPTQVHPTFVNYSTAQGLSSSVASAIAEDNYGRIYIGTWRGLDRLDPLTGNFSHYSTDDGLAPGKIVTALRDRYGRMWFGTPQGLSYFTPEPERPAAPPPILISGLSVGGARQTISTLGETSIILPDLAPDQKQLQIEFVALGFASGESLRYQFKLQGADTDWSPPTALRTVNYANLAPGSYAFLVRAVTSDGTISTTPASINFTVLRPIWQRWWFVALVVLAIGLAVFALYRYRVARILEVAGMRTRIATDLHDDIGANLTKIAILSEVAQQNARSEGGESDGLLSSIASISRESVSSMSDIVWAINPARDSLRDLVRRMRRHAEELFTGREVELDFLAPGDDSNLKLGVNVRRDLFLVYKEAVNNAARHAGATKVEVELKSNQAGLSLRVADNGKGFTPDTDGDGNGLLNMQRRATNLGGKFTLTSSAGAGTTILLTVSSSNPRPRLKPTSIRR